MDSLTSAINVQVDSRDKEQATNILKDLGLNMSTAINIFIKQIIKCDGLPFEVRNHRPNKELLDALMEGDDILSGKINAKKYSSVKKLIEDLENEN